MNVTIYIVIIWKVLRGTALDLVPFGCMMNFHI